MQIENTMTTKSTEVKLFVANLHFSATEGDLINLFQKYGTVISIQYMWHKTGPKMGQPKGFAFLTMSSEE